MVKKSEKIKMNFNILLVSFVIFSISFLTSCSGQNQLNFISDFKNINTDPELINLSNEFEINNNGGHIQGIQEFENKQGNYIFLSGSSDSYSYCAVVKSGDESKVVALNRLMDVPFKHAGGFQIFENYLAVGIEDNSLKDKSKVCVYDISNPKNPFTEPITVIERNGEPLRSTAGCVGITKYNNEILLSVGDWDTKHIDFYSAEIDQLAGKEFKKMSSVDIGNISRDGWITNEWHSYQNINLFNINEQLFLIGLGQNKQSENIADLFMISEESTGIFSFQKVASKTFYCTNECNFKAAAGAVYKNGEFKILASGYNIDSVSTLNVFSNK
jgi:hypothetical protein